MQVQIQDRELVSELQRRAIVLDCPVGDLVTAMLSVCLVRDDI